MPANYFPFRSLLLGLLLVVDVACSDSKKQDPAPSLPGVWTVQYVETNEYQADGSERSKSGRVAPAKPITYTFTTDRLTIKDEAYFLPPFEYTYTYTGNILALTLTNTLPGRFDQTVMHLDRSTLVLQDQRGSVTGGQTVTIFHLVR